MTTCGSSPLSRVDRRAELLKAGWAERFTAAPPRLEEAMEVFRGAGFEVITEPENPGAGTPLCTGCDPTLPGAATIWVRRPR